MKTFLLLAFSLTTALAQVVQAEDLDLIKHPNKQAPPPPPRRQVVTQAPRFERNAPVRQQAPLYRAPRFNPVNANQAPRIRQFVDRDAVRSNRFNQNPEFTPRFRTNADVVTAPQPTIRVPSDVNARRRNPDFTRVRTNPRVVTTQPTTTVQPDFNARNRFDRNRTDGNWPNRTSGNFDRDDARHHHHHHDRGWWRSRYSRFALFGGGYYYWNNNYWYPAYGYDPYYNSYSYEEPIYGYGDSDPGQVIASVQTELQRLGYYRYAVDGLMGPATRAAIARFQRDNGLPMTSGIDRPTLQSLGLG
ncbi:MAG: peptidoglycan-binding protein [Verrucomicrobiota bacterium]|nr:peptidoglycan-binding protein [Verrucomicrobiota bacterium]